MRYIQVCGKHFNKFIIVSDEDYKWTCKEKWFVNSSGYATNGSLYLHQVIMPKVRGKETEHKDGDKLNNQRSNLRYATRSQNHANRRKVDRNIGSRFKGVRFKKDTFRNKPWTAMVGKDHKVYRLGHFKTEEEAALAYNKKALELYGEFAKLNVI